MCSHFTLSTQGPQTEKPQESVPQTFETLGKAPPGHSVSVSAWRNILEYSLHNIELVDPKHRAQAPQTLQSKWIGTFTYRSRF